MPLLVAIVWSPIVLGFGYAAFAAIRGRLSAADPKAGEELAPVDTPFVQYEIATGKILQMPGGDVIGTGYSGNGQFLNDPQWVTAIGHGPIPPGRYTIGAAVDKPDSVGVFALPLEPDPANSMFGRSAFYVHGDNPKGDQSASDGCIVTDRPTREEIAKSTVLIVVNGMAA